LKVQKYKKIEQKLIQNENYRLSRNLTKIMIGSDKNIDKKQDIQKD